MLSLKAEQARREREKQAKIDARLAVLGRRHLADFLRAAWPVVEPGRPLVWGRHLDAMCEHLEAVTAGQIRNLIITIPPGCTKSRLVGVFWPAWTWLRWPESRWLFFSNSDELATRESLACRRLLESEWFRTHYPDAVKITSDQNAKQWYENDRAGHRQALSIGASVTGKKGDLLCVDDANDAEKVQSAAYRVAINNRWDNAIYDRVIDFKTGRRVLIGQRTHKDDLLGHVKATGEFEELCIPEEFESRRKTVTSIGWTDWRETEGEFLRPGQFGPEQKTAAVSRLGSMGYRAKHQQDPQSAEGILFKTEWLQKRWRRDPDSPGWVILTDTRGDYRFRLTGAPRHATADGASSAKTTADDTAISTWVVTPRGDSLWIGCRLAKLDIPDQPKLLMSEWNRHRWASIGIEAIAANRSLFQMAERLGLPAAPMTKNVDKLAHAQGALIEAENGRLWLPGPGEEPDFPLDTVLTQLKQFSGTAADKNDDIVDTLSYWVQRKPGLTPVLNAAPTAYVPQGPLDSRTASAARFPSRAVRR